MICPWMRVDFKCVGGMAAAHTIACRRASVERAGLLVTDIEVLRLRHAETLKAWRQRFLAYRDNVQRIYDARFVRNLGVLPAAAEMAFREQALSVFQIQLTSVRASSP